MPAQKTKKTLTSELLSSCPKEVRVPVCGYKWATYDRTQHESQHQLGRRDPYGNELSDGDLYLDNEQLHPEFKLVPITKSTLLTFLDPKLNIGDPDSILQVANKLGELSNPNTFYGRIDDDPYRPDYGIRNTLKPVETLNFWKHEISTIRWVGQLLEAIVEGNITLLQKKISFLGGPNEHNEPDGIMIDYPTTSSGTWFSFIINPFGTRATWEIIRENKFDLVFIARIQILETINHFLSLNHACHRFELMDNGSIGPSPKQLSLSASMWLQLAEWSANSSLYRRCPHCQQLCKTSNWGENEEPAIHNRETGHYIHKFSCYEAWIKQHNRKKKKVRQQQTP